MAVQAFQVGTTLRGLRVGRYTIEDAAGEADIGTSKLQRMETRDGPINRYLADLDKVARALGVPLVEIIEKARVRK